MLHLVLGQANPPLSQLGWMMQSLGSWSNLWVFVVGLAIFVGACRLILKNGRPAALAAYLVLLPLPVMISVSGTIKGMIASFMVISLSSIQLSQQDIAGGLAESLMSLFAAILISTPTYLVLAAALVMKSNQPEPARAPIAM